MSTAWLIVLSILALAALGLLVFVAATRQRSSRGG